MKFAYHHIHNHNIIESRGSRVVEMYKYRHCTLAHECPPDDSLQEAIVSTQAVGICLLLPMQLPMLWFLGFSHQDAMSPIRHMR